MNMIASLRTLRLNVKIALLGGGSVLVTALILVGLAAWQSGQYNRLAQGEVDMLMNADLDHITQGVYNLVRTENEAVQQQVDDNLNVARKILAGAGGASLAAQTVEWTAINQFTNKPAKIRLPRMLIGGTWLRPTTTPSVETPVVDEVTRLVGATATIFQRINDNGDMLRVATTVEGGEGKRAIGTYIPSRNPDGTPNPVISAILGGKTYHGRAYVVNTWYLTAYEPVRDGSGRLIGMLYVGVRQQSVESRVRQAILQTSVGKTGYVYVLGGRGEQRGRYIISQKGERDGENIWESRDSDGRSVIKAIITRALGLKPGEIATERYRWQNPGEVEPRWKVARLAYYEPWDWVIGISVYEDELRAYRTVLGDGRLRMTGIMAVAGLGITILMGLFGVFMAWTIARPIRRMQEAVETIIAGDLDQVVAVQSNDEIGALAGAFNMMTGRLNSTMRGLCESEKKFREIFENAVEGIFQTSLQGRFVNANPAMACILGYDSPDDLKEGITDIRQQLYARPEERDAFVARILEGEAAIGREVQFRCKDGRTIWVSVSARMVRDEAGSPLYIEGFLVDISDRKLAEETLKRNADCSAILLRINQMSGAAPGEIMAFAFEEAVRLTRSTIGYLAFLNGEETLLTMQLWSRGAMAQCGVDDRPLVYPVEDAGLWGEAVRQRSPVITNDYEAPSPWKKGLPEGHVPLRRHMNVPVMVGSRIVLVAGVGNKEDEYDETDVRQLTLLMEGMWRLMEHRRVDEKIREMNERFSSVLRASTAYSIIGTDTDGVIKVFNEGAELMLGYAADEVIDRATVEMIHDPGEVAARAAEMGISPGFEVLVSAARQGQTETREWTYIRTDGSPLTVSLTVTAMRSERGVLTGFIAIARDVTAEKKMEQQFIQSQKMESVGLLAGGVAHDFNNLLTPILGYTEILLSGFSEEDPRYRRLQQVQQAAERAKELTRRLLAFSRKQVIELKSVNLGDVIRQFESILRRTIRENIQIKFRISEHLGRVRADAGQIEQVLLNLAVNAQDAMPEGGVLTIEAMDCDLDESSTAGNPELRPGRHVMLAVSDTGVGMDKQTQEHIFEPFFTTKELGKGTGLGLSTVYGIVRQHGGSINVYSEENRGSAFKIFIPHQAERGVVDERPSSPEDAVAHGVETILVAEDNEMVRTLVNEMLTGLGYQVLQAESVEQCLLFAREHQGPINMLLTDVIMPKMNGKELFDQLSRILPELKVLFMSGYTSDVIGHHGVLGEGVDFLQKPFSQHVLSEKVRRVLDS
jgi:PAS domain S-box-containing protein